MNILSKLFGYVPADERKGIRLNDNDCWIISNYWKKDYENFFNFLRIIVPTESIIYIEGDSIIEKIREYYESKKISNFVKVEMGTIWPRPTFYHIPFNEENILKLIEFFNNYAEPEILDHLIIYKHNEVFISGYDFLDKEIWVSSLIDENKIKKFCEMLDAKYVKHKVET